jgi:sporulation protein YlmC with PRC-barrel domain
MKSLRLAMLGTAFVSFAAVAQTNPPAQTAPAANAPAATAQRPAEANRPMFDMKQGQWRSSKLTGLNVYNNDDKIGDINELIVGQDGRIEAVVIGVGGFLGIGEHNVAVPFNQVKFMEEARRTAVRTDADRPANAPATNPPAANTTGTVSAPAAPANRDATRADARADSRMDGAPDHAMINMTKDQLQALPQVRYAR